MLREREQTEHSRLLRHPARKRSESILSPRSPHGAVVVVVVYVMVPRV